MTSKKEQELEIAELRWKLDHMTESRARWRIMAVWNVVLLAAAVIILVVTQ